ANPLPCLNTIQPPIFFPRSTGTRSQSKVLQARRVRGACHSPIIRRRVRRLPLRSARLPESRARHRAFATPSLLRQWRNQNNGERRAFVPVVPCHFLAQAPLSRNPFAARTELRDALV